MWWAWLKDKVTEKARNFLLRILAAGPIPKHVAFVMDGNRRYARKNQLAVQQGHSEGYVALRRVLEICLRLKVHCVSVYAFSIENFKRSEEEVNVLMNLAEEKLLELCKHGDLLDEYGVRLNVLGKKSLLPISVQRAAEKAENLTRHNKRAILNLCMPYTSRDEITTAVESCIRSAQPFPKETISERDLDAHLMTSKSGSPPLDILVRTSGVKRLSDFMLWQCCENTQIQFSNSFWPDFGLFNFVPILLDYQRKVWDSNYCTTSLME